MELAAFQIGNRSRRVQLAVVSPLACLSCLAFLSSVDSLLLRRGNSEELWRVAVPLESHVGSLLLWREELPMLSQRVKRLPLVIAPAMQPRLG
jgi:hypothetical protein